MFSQNIVGFVGTMRKLFHASAAVQVSPNILVQVFSVTSLAFWLLRNLKVSVHRNKSLSAVLSPRPLCQRFYRWPLGQLAL